jgi:CRISPR-associated protein Cas1
MSTLYVTQQDTVVRKTDERLKVTQKTETLLDVPMLKVSQVVVFGRVTVTAPTLQALLEHHIPVCYLSAHGRYVGRIEPALSKNALLRSAQYRLAAVAAVKNLDQLRGLEGAGSALYFGVFDNLLKPSGMRFAKRVRRPPTDPVNALLSFGYALLANDIHSAVNTVGFDPYQGYLHVEHYGRPSLALDLMEEFRPLIVDSVVLTCINKRIIGPEDFSVELGNVHRLTETARRKFLMQYEERKNTEIQHPIFTYKASYQRCFELQARLLAKVLKGEIAEYPPFMTR